MYSSEIEGGELAAQFSPQERMQMIQRGYNPMSPSDVEAFKRGQRPQEGLHEIAGVNKYRSLGMARADEYKDNTMINKKFNFNEDIDIEEYDSRPVNPREALAGKMEVYGNRSGDVDLNDKLMSKIGSPMRESNTPSRKPQIQAPKAQSNKKIITEASTAGSAGYTLGVRYINAFITNLKNPTSQNRSLLMKEMNNLVLAESRIHPTLLPQYKAGIAKAEKELYLKIKNK
jgi:hypothetical protein